MFPVSPHHQATHLVEAARGHAIYMTSPEGILLSWNPGVELILGYRKEEWIGRASEFVFTLEDRTAGIPQAQFHTALTTGIAEDTRWHNHKDGSQIFVDTTLTPIFDEASVLLGFGTLLRDATERYNTEQALRASEEFLRRVIESSPDCIKTLDIDGNVLAMNEGGQKIMEIDNFAAVCGLDWRTFWNDEGAVAVDAALQMAKNGETGHFQGFCPTMKGSPRWWDVVVVPILGTDGKPELLLGVSRDITGIRLLAERERNIAQQLQAALQPPLSPYMPGLSLGGYYESALAEAGVGGDFYDVFSLDTNRTAIVIGDLSGKGLAAASEVATVRNMLRCVLYLPGKTLSSTVNSLNLMLADHKLLKGFATLFVGLYDQSERTLEYVNCGQESVIIWRSVSGALEFLPPTGPVLGACGHIEYTKSVISLNSGDVFAAFTDGLTETGPTRHDLLELSGVSDMFLSCCTTAQTLAHSASSQSAISADAIIADLISRVKAYAQNKVWDDMCLLVGIAD